MRRLKQHQQPWAACEINLLGTAIDRVIAARIGRTQGAVRGKRNELGVLPFERSHRHRKSWTKRQLALLGRHSDAEVARRVGCSRRNVGNQRARLGIESAHPECRPN